ncbi:lipase family protein [Corynebacterium bovis]|uniref:lipase family protein n=1 Tax=Corynebacterium bovis TaxID=36808 RepID=UPI003139E6EA
MVTSVLALTLAGAVTATAPASAGAAVPAPPAGSLPGVPAVPGLPALPALPSGPVLSSTDDPFYTPPAELPPTPGAVIRSRPAPQLLDLAGVPGPGQARSMLYTSTREDGVPVAVSGVVIEPTTPWSGPGPVPTIVFAPGTRGGGDSCAPSRSVLQTVGGDPAVGAVNVNYEIPFYQLASVLGMRVVVTDYIGLGTPGQHTYVDTVEEGRAVLDAARAALALDGQPADSPVGFYGYSQGGGAVAAAAELAASYAPELTVKGTYAGAPPANLRRVLEAVDGNAIAGVIGYTLAGQLERHPDLAPLVDVHFNERGKRFLADTPNRCITDSVATWGFTSSRSLTKTGESFGEIVDNDPTLSGIVAAQMLGTRPVSGPVLILNAVNDDTIPFDQARELAREYCEQGATVQFTADPMPSVLPGSSLNHAVPLVTNLPQSFAYMLDRFRDVPAPSSCGELT